MSILVDTSILLRLREPGHPDHATCVQAMRLAETQRPRWFSCAQVLIEYWAVATRPRAVNGLGLSPEEASRDLDLIDLLLECLLEPPDIVPKWRSLVVNNLVLGRKAHDARLVALMLSHGVRRVVTLNERDFRRYNLMIECLTPTQLLDSWPLP